MLPKITSGQYAAISPVQFKPTQDTLVVDDERSAKINYIVGKRIAGTPAIPGIVGRGQIPESGTPGAPDYQPYVPAIEGRAEVPAVPDQIVPVESGSVTMTDEEWAAWDSTTDDTEYRIRIVVSRLKLTLVS